MPSITIDLTERELFVIANALNYAKNEWAMFDGDMIERDDDLLKLSDDADTLETRLKEFEQCHQSEIAEKVTTEVAKICGCNWESCTAIRNERERCRKIAQSWEHRSDVNPARAIASAIQQGIEP